MLLLSFTFVLLLSRCLGELSFNCAKDSKDVVEYVPDYSGFGATDQDINTSHDDPRSITCNPSSMLNLYSTLLKGNDSQTMSSVKGPKGDLGKEGAMGLAGVSGPKGDAGIGPTGMKGESGFIGPAGPSGEIGPIGPKGAAGDIGQKGISGSQGPPGPRGLPGPPGNCLCHSGHNGGFGE